MFDGDAEALFSVGRRFLTGNGVDKDEDKGRQMISEAAAMGHSMAIQFLASLNCKPAAESTPTEKPVCAHNPAIDCPCPKECPRHGKCCACARCITAGMSRMYTRNTSKEAEPSMR